MVALQRLSHFLDLQGLLLLLFPGELGRVGCRACPAEAPVALAAMQVGRAASPVLVIEPRRETWAW